MSEYKKELAFFVDKMELKLERNRHKETWKVIPDGDLLAKVDDLLGNLADEIEELSLAIFDAETKGMNGYSDAILECADAANYLMMIADILRIESLKKDKEGGHAAGEEGE